MNHYYHHIEGWFDFQDLYTEQVARVDDGATIVEVGTHKGRSLVYLGVEILNSKKGIRLCSVECDASVVDELHGNMYPCVREGLIWHHSQDESLSAADRFPDGSCDFVFIDADHSYQGVRVDLYAWWPKVKSGGILAGHDFIPVFPGVIDATKEFFGDKLERASKTSWLVRKP